MVGRAQGRWQPDVALRKESVDRNCYFCNDWPDFCLSLSARRAWIEINGALLASVSSSGSLSARRAWIEIIDDFEPSTTRRSLSARRAWIEIAQSWRISGRAFVALRKESVDRNHCRCYPCNTCYRSLSARRAWIEITGMT